MYPTDACYAKKGMRLLSNPKAEAAKGGNLTFDTHLPFDTFKAQILVKIDRALKPAAGRLHWNRFEVQWCITRVQKALMPLADEDDWRELLNLLAEHDKPNLEVKIRVLQLKVSSFTLRVFLSCLIQADSVLHS